jgi:hypothetical protein
MFFVDVKFFIFWYINEVIILINLTLGGKMAGDEIEINIFCAKTECRSKIETVSVKKENMMLTSSEKIFCPSCNEEVTEYREITGRNESKEEELNTLPASDYMNL